MQNGQLLFPVAAGHVAFPHQEAPSIYGTTWSDTQSVGDTRGVLFTLSRSVVATGSPAPSQATAPEGRRPSGSWWAGYWAPSSVIRPAG